MFHSASISPAMAVPPEDEDEDEDKEGWILAMVVYVRVLTKAKIVDSYAFGDHRAVMGPLEP